jgi:hypothetical protein
MPFTSRPDAEPIPGYRLLARLCFDEFGEVWTCTAPDGGARAVRLIRDADSRELAVWQALEGTRHPSRKKNGDCSS